MVIRRTAVACAVLAIAAGLPGCGNDAASAKRPATAVAVPVSVAPAQQRSMPVRLHAIGNVEAFSTVSLKARVDGQIMAVNFTEGKEVRKGEILFRIDPRSFEAALRQAEANALRDAAARDQARSQERRYKELLDKSFVSKEAYAQIRTNADVAEATARASEAGLENARLSLEHCTIAAPIDGVPGKVLLQVGNLVKANDTGALVVINQVKPVFVNFAIPEQDLPVIRKSLAAGPLGVDAAASKSDTPLAHGSLVFIDNSVDQATGTIRMRAQFDNRDVALWPGQFVNVRVKLYDDPAAIAVPSRAVQTGPVGQFVFVVKDDMTAEIRAVTVARSEDDIAIVSKGLTNGEQVVVRGALRLSPGAKVIIQPEAAKG